MAAELAIHVISAAKLPDLAEFLNRSDSAGDPPVKPGDVSRIYFGSEFCVHLLPSPAELDSALSFADDVGLPLTFVTPYGGDTFLDKVAPLVKKLPTGSEVVLNDWGALHMFSRSDEVVPILGRLLSKLIRDPWVQREWAEGGKQAHALHLPVQLMEAIGAQRAETDVLPGGYLPDVEEGHDVELSLYLPWSPLATGRVCFAGSFGAGPSPRFGVMDDCARSCRHVHMKLNDPSAPECDDVASTLLAGNTMFYEHPPEAVTKALGNIAPPVTRIIWEPWIPA